MSRAPGDRKRSTRESCLPGAGRIRRSRRHEDLGCSPEAPTDEDKTMTDAELDQLSVNTIRTLSIDAVERAKSGHPGTPMALAPLVYTIWNRVMRFDPADPIWPNRDRFVLSNGHASMLLWSVLHLTGTRAVNADYERLGQPSVSLEDIRRFRQIGSKAPGHPEYHWVSGVETTTGPLGQGAATSVGMAIARKWLADRYNKPGFPIFDYDIYVVVGDGCLMEGIGSEAASLAGHLGLDNLCWVYDNNHITIEGNTSLAFTEDVAARFQGYGWNVLRVGDANDLDRIEKALGSFRETKGRPTLIILDSHIGYGSPHKHDTSAAHGEPLGEEEVRLTKRSYGWPEDAQFLVPDGVREHFAAGIGARGAAARSQWTALFGSYRAAYPELATEIYQMQRRDLPTGWDRNLPVFPAGCQGRRGPGRLGQSAQCARAERPVAPRRGGRPPAVQQDDPDVRRRGKLPGRDSERQEPAFRHPRARDGGDRQRALAVEAAAFRRDIFHLQRLRPTSHPALGADGAADRLRVHARLHGRRRGWPDPPARGAPGIPARHPRARHVAARRRQRGRRGVSLRDAAAPPAGRDRAVSAAAADSGPARLRLPRGGRARRLRGPGPTRGGPRGDIDRLRQRADSRLGGPRKAARRGHTLARRLDAVVGHLRPPDPGVSGQRAASPREGAGR